MPRTRTVSLMDESGLTPKPIPRKFQSEDLAHLEKPFQQLKKDLAVIEITPVTLPKNILEEPEHQNLPECSRKPAATKSRSEENMTTELKQPSIIRRTQSLSRTCKQLAMLAMKEDLTANNLVIYKNSRRAVLHTAVNGILNKTEPEANPFPVSIPIQIPVSVPIPPIHTHRSMNRRPSVTKSGSDGFVNLNRGESYKHPGVLRRAGSLGKGYKQLPNLPMEIGTDLANNNSRPLNHQSAQFEEPAEHVDNMKIEVERAVNTKIEDDDVKVVTVVKRRPGRPKKQSLTKSVVNPVLESSDIDRRYPSRERQHRDLFEIKPTVHRRRRRAVQVQEKQIKKRAYHFKKPKFEVKQEVCDDQEVIITGERHTPVPVIDLELEAAPPENPPIRRKSGRSSKNPQTIKSKEIKREMLDEDGDSRQAKSLSTKKKTPSNKTSPLKSETNPFLTNHPPHSSRKRRGRPPVRTNPSTQPVKSLWQRLCATQSEFELPKTFMDKRNANLKRAFCFVEDKTEDWSKIHNENVENTDNSRLLLINVRNGKGTGCAMVEETGLPQANDFKERDITTNYTVSKTQSTFEDRVSELKLEQSKLRRELFDLDNACNKLQLLYATRH